MSGKTVAIVGGGFCGVVTAVHLLKSSPAAVSRIILIEKRSQIGRGVAYGTSDSQHLLNVPAGRMSALAQDDEHFVRFVCQGDPTCSAETFVPRMTYGHYLESTLNDAIRQRSTEIDFHTLHDTAIDIEILVDGRAALTLNSDRVILADAVVIANGNIAIKQPSIGAGILSSPRYISDPWAEDALSRLDPLQDTLLLGAGLTAVDVACSLTQQMFRPIIHMVSRHGLQAQTYHTSDGPVDKPSKIEIPLSRFTTIRKAVKAIRQQVNVSTSQGSNWRDVFTSLRSKTAQIWQSLPENERSRFLRHMQPYWDIHRHRAAPTVAAKIEQHAIRGDLIRHAGRIIDLRETSNGIHVTIRERGCKIQKELTVGSVINCTGQCNDVSAPIDPLMSNLHQRGLLKVDPLKIGIQCADNYALIDNNGLASTTLYYIGPLLRAKYWEATAVPDLRHHIVAAVRGILLSMDICHGRTGEITQSSSAEI